MRIVLLGATGYTGRLTAEAMVRAGLAPVLAGRHHEAVARLADRLAPLAPSRDVVPRTAIADVSDPRSVRDLLESPEDVLVTTVGPFMELGSAAVEAAVDAGAAYLDSTGEPPFIRRVFQDWGPRAQGTGARLMTAFGYDYVPGNLAGALALRRCREAGRPASRLDIGYFIDGSFGISSGTRASAAGVLLAPSYAFSGGTIVERRTAGGRTRTFDLGRSREWSGLPVAGSEHLSLPMLDDGLADVEVWLGWAGRWTTPAAYAGTALGALASLPRVGTGMSRWVSRRAARTTGTGPDAAGRAGARTVVQADASDAVGRPLASVRLEGPSPYDLTADLLAWGAAMAATRTVAPGAHGPVDAFGLEHLERGCADMGLVAVT
ncbi:MAG: saccharopine dehydrogenase family protein [Candidatus Nanopelagicales bacterium]